jgi:hypothetical protein
MADVAANQADQAAAAAAPTTTASAAPDINARPPVLHPQLFVAARRGDIEGLKELLRLRNDGDQQGGPAAATATTTAQVVLEVDRPPAAAPLLHLLDGVTRNEGDSLLHVVAACGGGGGQDFLDCAKTIYRARSGLLVARNNRGDTPLHCAAGAGNAIMISCLVGLAAAEDEATTMTEFLRMRNKCGETALHKAVRAGSMASMDELMSVDPELATVPSEADEGNTTSPLYLAISLGKEDIAEHLIQKSNGRLSCSGPHRRNVLHAAVTRRKGTCVLFHIPHI